MTENVSLGKTTHTDLKIGNALLKFLTKFKKKLMMLQ